VLALSVVLVNGYGPGHAPSLLDYGVFCGAGALLFAVAGLAAIFFEPLQGIIILAVDGIASFFLLAGAAVGYLNFINALNVSCADDSSLRHLSRKSRRVTALLMTTWIRLAKSLWSVHTSRHTGRRTRQRLPIRLDVKRSRQTLRLFGFSSSASLEQSSFLSSADPTRGEEPLSNDLRHELESVVWENDWAILSDVPG